MVGVCYCCRLTESTMCSFLPSDLSGWSRIGGFPQRAKYFEKPSLSCRGHRLGWAKNKYVQVRDTCNPLGHVYAVVDPGFPRGGATPEGAPTYCFVNCYRKLHENDKLWTDRSATVMEQNFKKCISFFVLETSLVYMRMANSLFSNWVQWIWWNQWCVREESVWRPSQFVWLCGYVDYRDVSSSRSSELVFLIWKKNNRTSGKFTVQVTINQAKGNRSI